MRSMHSTLASFQLAVTVLPAIVPVHLICLALNLCTHVNQSARIVHSLDPQPLPLRNLLEGINPPLFNLWRFRIRGMPQVSICALFFWFGSGPVTPEWPDRCVDFANSDLSDTRGLVVGMVVEGGPSGDIVENCMKVCQAEGYSLAVWSKERNDVRASISLHLFDDLSSTDQTSLLESVTVVVSAEEPI